MRIKIHIACVLLLAPPLTNQGWGAAEDAPALREAAGYYQLGSTGKALDVCITALNKNPADKNLYSYALEILPEGPSTHAAALREITDKAYANKTDEYIYYLGFCKLFRGAGQLPQALSNCKKARALDPTSWTVYRELGLTYSASGDGARAVATLTQGAELSQDNYKAYYYLADEHERLKNDTDALENYRKSLSLIRTANDPAAQIYSGLIQGKIKMLAAKPAKKPAPAKTPAKPVESGASEKLFKACENDAENLKKSGDTIKIENKLADCSALAPRNPQIKINRAAYLLRLGKYTVAIEEYQKAAALLGGSDPMTAFCHLKIAQTYFKLNDITKAVQHYTKALEINKNDLNAMLGLAEACEAKADLKTAGDLYARILKAEPGNTKAREHLDKINFNLLSNSQLLDELRDRGEADDKKTAASPDDLKLLSAIHRAERNGAVDYLRAKTIYTNGLFLEKQEKHSVRLMLTLAGFKSYQGYLTRDAIIFFEKKGITLRDIFTLRDLKGLPVFDPGGRLTGEGMQAYWLAVTGEKTWLMHYEAVATPEEEKLTAEAEKLMSAGFREISESEYLWLMKATDCPDDILRSAPCDIRLLKMQRSVKYFLCYFPPPTCSAEASTLSTYIERYRASDSGISELTRSTDFFGSGGVAKKRFCNQGKIWNGE
ncbi:MAG: tetratricopeptide repeat protein [Elusimicrobiota bacterium]